MKMSCWIIRSKALVFSLVLLLGVAGFLHNNNVFIHHHHHFSNSIDNQQLPVIYVITPTYRRLVQLAELTQLAQTLSLVPSVHWIVVEDSQELSPDVIRLLQRFTGLSIGHITHLHGRMPEQFRANDSTTPYTSRPRGASNRNRALHWIRENVETGVVYFADDDNTYDVRIFQEMRYTKTISMWPVGLIGIHGVSSPVVDPSTGYVKAFFDGWIGDRIYPVDMASFAINVQLLHQVFCILLHRFFVEFNFDLNQKNPDAVMSYRAGYQEDSFLKSLNFTLKDIEPKANNCTEVILVIL
jgi:beta-1,3-glucuronyltransferase